MVAYIVKGRHVTEYPTGGESDWIEAHAFDTLDGALKRIAEMYKCFTSDNKTVSAEQGLLNCVGDFLVNTRVFVPGGYDVSLYITLESVEVTMATEES